MFKVICIDDAKRSNKTLNPSGWVVKSGEIYTVIDEYIYDGHISYALFEDPDNVGYGWDSNRFIPLSNIDEREILAERYGVFAENNFA